MKLIEAHEGWNGSITWVRRHESDLFTMKICVHSERVEADHFLPPRTWNSYLLGGDRCRWYRGEKPETYVELDAVTSLVSEKGQEIFDALDWNGGVTCFKIDTQNYPPHQGIRQWDVGDDYAHIWDRDGWNDYDFNHVRFNLEKVASQFVELLSRHGIKNENQKNHR